MKKLMTKVLLFCSALVAVTGCGGSDDGFKLGNAVNIITREEGSGTRGAFTELFELEERQADGLRKDLITKEASVESNTNTILTTVQNDVYSIGYISMGSLNNNVKALQIDGVNATATNVQNGTYAISRPFNIATKGEATGLTKDFIDFILSEMGQVVVSDSYIPVSQSAPSFASSTPSGTITVGGSSSVAPLMEKLIEAYKLVNPEATIQLQTSDSSIGMTQTVEGGYDIGMASRELRDSEKSELIDQAIALDGIAVIVNLENPTISLSKTNVQKIYLGEATSWEAFVA
jgi:ABC-type phosphate transport system, periplasmic component